MKPLKPGMRVLDLGCGTGDLSLGAVPLVGKEGSVVGIDFSDKMLEVANQRGQSLESKIGSKPRFVLMKAEELPIANEQPFDLVVSGFVLRNLYQNIDAILKGVSASLKVGGQISFLDITAPKQEWRVKFFRFYMHTMTALYGRLLFGKVYPIAYLPDSAERFVKVPEFIEKLKKAGFRDIRFRSFMLGTVTLYQATK